MAREIATKPSGLPGATNVRGVVTVGSPNNGSEGLNSFINGSSDAVLNTAYNELNAGPRLDPVSIAASHLGITAYNNLLLILKGTFPKSGIIQDLGFVNNIKHLLFSTVELARRYLLTDGGTYSAMRKGSSYMSNLNNRNTNVPIISIVTSKNSESSARLAGSFLRYEAINVNNEGLHNHEDGKVLWWKNRVKDYYSAREIADYIRYYNPFFLYRARQWRKGKIYVRDRYNPDYNVLIDAVNRSIRRSRIAYREECREVDVPLGELVPLSAGTNGLTELICEWVPYTQYYWETIIVKSDGLFNTEEQKAINSTRIIEAPEVNHMEVHNHENMTAALNDVFNQPFGSPFRRVFR
jgi:hypothetical protein